MTTRKPRPSRREVLGALAAGSVWLGLDGRLSAAAPTDKKPEVTFGLLADAQYADAQPAMDRQYRESVRKLAEAVGELNQRKLDFTIHLGDFIDRDFASFRAVASVYEKLACPHYHVLGNHDFSVAPADKPKVLATMGLDKLGSRAGYYDFTVARWRFVALNGTDVSTYANAPRSAKHTRARALMSELKKRKRRNAAPWNGGFGAEQLAWLGRTLAAADKARQRVVLFNHMPLFPDNAHNLYNDTDVLAVLDKHPNVAAVFTGHNHAGNYGARNAVHHLTLRGMVQTRRNAYAVVEAYADRLRVTGFGREPSRTMTTRTAGALARGTCKVIQPEDNE